MASLCTPVTSFIVLKQMSKLKEALIYYYLMLNIPFFFFAPFYLF